VTDSTDTNAGPRTWLTNFVSLAPRLERLSLFFDSLDIEHLDSWTQTSVPSGHFADNIHIARLRHLEFGNAVLAQRDLEYFLKKHAVTLSTVSLLRLGLRSSHDHEPDWPLLLRLLDKSRDGANLGYMELSCLYETDGSIVIFEPIGMEECIECN